MQWKRRSPRYDDFATVLLAGRAADELISGGAHAGAASDLQQATRLISDSITKLGLGNTLLITEDNMRFRYDDLIDRELKRLFGRACEMVGSHRREIALVADHLLRERVLTAEQVKALLSAGNPNLPS